MNRILVPAALVLLGGSFIALNADAQNRGRIELSQTMSSCNTDLVSNDNDDNDDNDSAGGAFGAIQSAVSSRNRSNNNNGEECQLQATVLDSRGRPVRGAQVQLFYGEDQGDDTITTSGYKPFRRIRTTNQSGRTAFNFQSPDDGACYQARSRQRQLSSNILCISPDETTSSDSQGNNRVTVVSEDTEADNGNNGSSGNNSNSSSSANSPSD